MPIIQNLSNRIDESMGGITSEEWEEMTARGLTSDSVVNSPDNPPAPEVVEEELVGEVVPTEDNTDVIPNCHLVSEVILDILNNEGYVGCKFLGGLGFYIPISKYSPCHVRLVCSNCTEGFQARSISNSLSDDYYSQKAEVVELANRLNNILFNN